MTAKNEKIFIFSILCFLSKTSSIMLASVTLLISQTHFMVIVQIFPWTGNYRFCQFICLEAETRLLYSESIDRPMNMHWNPICVWGFFLLKIAWHAFRLWKPESRLIWCLMILSDNIAYISTCHYTTIRPICIRVSITITYSASRMQSFTVWLDIQETTLHIQPILIFPKKLAPRFTMT